MDLLGQGFMVNVFFMLVYVECWVLFSFLILNINDVVFIVVVVVDDIFGNIFDGLFIFLDFVWVCVVMECIDLVDVWGMLVIFGGIYDVLCEKCMEYCEVCFDVKVGFLFWIDIIDIVFEFLLIDELGVDILVIYNFWSDDVKEVVVVINVDLSGMEV